MWIRKTPDPETPHDCDLPIRDPETFEVTNPDTKKVDTLVDWGAKDRPEGQEGDIWVCDVCLTVWQVQREQSWSKKPLVWRLPNWFVRWMALRAYAKRLES